jgi:hypothetical protein
MIKPNNWIVELYKGRSIKRGFIIQKLEDVSFYLKPFGVADDVIESTIKFLVRQAENPSAFPNVILFLDDDNCLMGIDDFMESWKRKI